MPHPIEHPFTLATSGQTLLRVTPGLLGREIRDLDPSVHASNRNKACCQNTVPHSGNLTSRLVAQHPVHGVTSSHSVVQVLLYMTRWHNIATYGLRDSFTVRVQTNTRTQRRRLTAHHQITHRDVPSQHPAHKLPPHVKRHLSLMVT